MLTGNVRKGIALTVVSAAALLAAACSPVTSEAARPAPAVASAEAPALATQAAATTAPEASATEAPLAPAQVSATPSAGVTVAIARGETTPAAATEANQAGPAGEATQGSTPATPAAASTTETPTAAAQAAPACTPGALTPALTEGPYYKANPPENSNLLGSGMSGTKLTLTGYVLDANCKPIPGARVDLWQADSEGQYDNSGYTLRGYQVTDAQGRYSVETVVPGVYPGRTRHIHVKVTPPNGATLTTQLFFPNEPLNSSDGIFAAQNVVQITNGANGEVATFNFVLKQ